MLKLFYPYNHIKNVFFIDYELLYQKGYRGIIFDLDNTLVHHGDESNSEIELLFLQLKQIGIKTLILSNNNEKRVITFLKNIDSLYICNADKPKIKNYKKAISMLNLKKDKIIYIGDQIFTDIYGANKCGIPSILVNYIKDENSNKIGKKRYLEKLLLYFYHKSKKYNNRLGNISKGE